MARRVDRDDRPTPAEQAARDADSAERRYRRMAMFLAASEPGSIAADLSDAIRRERDRLDAAGSPIAQRLAALERWLAARGLLRGASAHADRLAEAAQSFRSSRW